MSSSGSASSVMPCAVATALPSSTSALDHRAEVGPLAHAPVREAREGADRVRRRIEDDFAPLRTAGVRNGVRGHACAGARVCEPLDLVSRRRARLERAERRVSLHVPLHDAGSQDLPCRKRRPADDAPDVPRDRLFVSHAVLHRGDALRPRTRAPSPSPRRPCASLSSPRSRSRTPAPRTASAVARTRPTTSPAPVRRSPSALIASTCARSRSYAHTSTSASSARLAAKSDPTAPQPTMQTLTGTKPLWPGPAHRAPTAAGCRRPLARLRERELR